MADVAPVVVFKKRAGKATAARKRAATPPPASDSSSDYSSEEENGVRIKRRRVGGITAAAAVSRGPKDFRKAAAFAGDRSTTLAVTDDATKISNWHDSDASSKPMTASRLAVAEGPDGSYKGQAGYSSFIQKNADAPQRSVGPVKAATNIRTITVTDFAPDVCKDYKQTGFCGFGDSCKFLHAREDYKQGWQLDKEWENVTKGKKLDGTVVGRADKSGGIADEDEESILDNIPFACIICRESYKSPVVTKCRHYFCEPCALKRHRSKGGKGCAACGTDTGGSFSVAKNLRRLLDKKKERVKRQKEKAREEGLEVSSDEEAEV